MLEAVRDGQTGWMCERAAPDALAEVLSQAERSGREELRRRGELGWRWSSETFGCDQIALANQAVYESVLCERGSQDS